MPTIRLLGPVPFLSLLGLLVADRPLDAAPRIDVSDDGRTVSRYEGDSGGGGELLLGSSEVPFAASPDWTGDLERAVGGLEFGDFDNDGDLDLACGCYNASSSFPPITIYYTLIYRNDGGVLETTPSWTSTDQRHTADVRFGDVDGDGRADLYASNGGQGLDPSVIYLNGPGGIDPTPDWTAADATWSLGSQIADLNDDGRLDLIVANQGNTIIPWRPVSVFFNGVGGLQTVPGWTSADSALSNAVSVADLDGSSLVSVIAHTLVGDGTTQIFTLPHVPVASLERLERVDQPGLPPYTADLRLARLHFASAPATGAVIEVDYTYAAHPDVAFSRWVNYATGIYSNSMGTLSSLPTWTTGDPSRADKGIGFSDVDDDGDADLVVAGSDPTELWRNDGGTLAGPVWSPTNTYWGAQDLDWCDIDGDGDEDLATIHFGNRQIRIYLNRDGVLDPVPSWVYALASSATEIAFGDVNGDGFVDLAAGTARNPLVLFTNLGPPVAAPEGAVEGAVARIVAEPNPFRRQVRLLLPAPLHAPGALRIIDAAGRRVRTLPLSPGGREVLWDGRGRDGRPLAAGVYWIVAEGTAEPVRGQVVRIR